MRVFVVGTGRCGTSTFYRACTHITNFTAGHESAAGYTFPFEYPDNHIEVAGHISMELGLLVDAYPNSKWVHLIRDRDSCIDSIANTAQIQLDAFARHWMQIFQGDIFKIATSYYDCLNTNIRRMLIGLDSMTIETELAGNKWEEFWDWIEAKGDFDLSQKEWKRKYNRRENRGRDAF